MKRLIRQKLTREKVQIIRRLECGAAAPDTGPVIRASNVHYELADKSKGIRHGGIGAMHLLVRKLGLAQGIDSSLELLRAHKPYHESDHVLNIAYNVLCGGRTLDDIELRRNDRVFLDALGATSIPDPTTAGDFCRRFQGPHIWTLQEVINEARLKVWREQAPEFFAATARIDADGTIVSTDGCCKEGMDIAYTREWGYSTLVVSLANTGEPLFVENRSGNRPSHEGVVPLFDRAVSLCRAAGFTDVLLRGDSDFSITTEFDRWDEEGVRFVFGYDARPNLKAQSAAVPDDIYRDLVRRAEREVATRPRARPQNVKDRIVRERGYQTLRPEAEMVIDFEYRPVKCRKHYRVVALRKNITVTRGDTALFDEIRYFFYITNDRSLTVDEVVHEARGRCNQENLIEQLKNGVHALRAPVNTLNANWAYMVMTALAWSMKAWAALSVPASPRWKDRHSMEREELLRMDFRTFLAAFIDIPAQIITAGRRIIFRLLAWSPWQHVFFRLLDGL